jgi:hypothetical protein
MPASIVRSGLAVGVLLCALLGLCVWFGALGPAPGLGAYPDSRDVGATPAEHVGSQVEISGTVRETEPVVITLDYEPTFPRVVVTGLETDVERGDGLRVVGTLTGERTVRATNAFVVPRWGTTYTVVISFVAGLWVLARIVAGWRLDPNQRLVPREATWSPVRSLRRWARRTRAEPTESERDA